MAPPANGLHGIILVDKPAGWTSHDVVAKARGLTGQRKIGHTGTLDPMATGLLVLCLGKATRLAEYMTAHDKRYEGEITLGVTTDSDDAAGVPIGGAEVPDFDDATLRAVAATFTGQLLQRPPAYSAVKVGGRRAYVVARQGGRIDLAPRPVRVYSLDLRRRGGERLGIAVDCGPGTYVRSLARDIGEVLGCGGHLSALRRTRSGSFGLAEAIRLEVLEDLSRAQRIEEVLLEPDEGVSNLAAGIVSDDHARMFAQGQPFLPAGHTDVADSARIYSAGGRFMGVASVEAGGLVRASKVLDSPD